MHLALCHCSTCRQRRGFEQPPCVDGHGGECPERTCVHCGSAIIVGLGAEIADPTEVISRAA